MHSRFMRAVAAPLLALHVAACTQWQRVSAPSPREAIAEAGSDQVRLAVRDEARPVVLGDFTVEGDSVRGITRGAARTSRSIPLGDVERVEARRYSAAKTGGAVLATAVVGGVIFLLTWSPDFCIAFCERQP
ncbi:MAG TPA: hypothetical protein VLA09_04630 [Longimicrobiales bacterium]|nr:hypothetical protein [Longimicrobiales bacterium]